MNGRTWRLGTCVVSLLAAACTTGTVPTAPSSTAVTTAPTPAPPPSPPPAVPIGGAFPTITSPARIFVALSVRSYPYHGGQLWSRYVLYDDRRFALQYSSTNFPFFEYPGTYDERDGNITFHWEGWSTAGPWGATGTLQGDTLTVRYNLIMQLSDFEDGTFVRMR